MPLTDSDPRDRPRTLVIGAGEVGTGTIEALLDQRDINGSVDPVGIATRRPEQTREEISQRGEEVPVFGYEEIPDLAQVQNEEGVDVALLCNSSQSLWYHSKEGISRESGPEFARIFPIVADTYDNHKEMASYAEAMSRVARDRLALIGFGWDPGVYFSNNKKAKYSFFPNSVTNIFYGPGKSQGHTTILKEDENLIEMGLLDAIQFTMRKEDSLERVREGEMVELSTGERMWRDVYLLTEEGAPIEEMAGYIKSIKGYFDEYDVRVTSVDQERMEELNTNVGHRGTVITTGRTRRGSNIVVERSVEFESNAEATGCLLASAGIAGYKAYKAGMRSVAGPGDIPRNFHSSLSPEQIWEQGL